MAIDVSAETFEPKPEGVADAKLYRYGLDFYEGEQEFLILFCEEHVKKGSPAGSAPTSVKIVLGLEGPSGKVRCDHYVGLTSNDRERFANVLGVLEPQMAAAIKAKRKSEPFRCENQVGKRGRALIESEAGRDGYGDRPRVTRLVALLGKDAPKAQPAPKAAATPVQVADMDLPF